LGVMAAPKEAAAAAAAALAVLDADDVTLAESAPEEPPMPPNEDLSPNVFVLVAADVVAAELDALFCWSDRELNWLAGS